MIGETYDGQNISQTCGHNTQKIDPLKDLFGWSETQDWHPENFL